MNKESLNGIKQQLWDYYRKITEYATSLAEEKVFLNLLTGERTVELVIPSGLEYELGFTEDEIRLWKKYEERFLEF
jgi:hypothetical protein